MCKYIIVNLTSHHFTLDKSNSCKSHVLNVSKVKLIYYSHFVDDETKAHGGLRNFPKPESQ